MPMQVQARLKFTELDTNHDGTLDEQELRKLASWVWLSFQPGSKPLTPEEMARESTKLLQLSDKNDDGVVDLGEFTAWFEGVFSSLSLCQVVHTARVETSSSVETSSNTASRFELELMKLKERASNAQAIIESLGEDTDSASLSPSTNTSSQIASPAAELEDSIRQSDTAERIYSELDRIETIILNRQTDANLVNNVKFLWTDLCVTGAGQG